MRRRVWAWEDWGASKAATKSDSSPTILRNLIVGRRGVHTEASARRQAPYPHRMKWMRNLRRGWTRTVPSSAGHALAATMVWNGINSKSRVYQTPKTWSRGNNVIQKACSLPFRFQNSFKFLLIYLSITVFIIVWILKHGSFNWWRNDSVLLDFIIYMFLHFEMHFIITKEYFVVEF